MAEGTRTFRCLIISPGDVPHEREFAEMGIRRWNETEGDRLGLRIDPLRWERHGVPDAGTEAQQVLNRQLVNKADFGIAMFWTRLGTPTGSYPSGSAEEIALLSGSGRRVMVYIRNSSPPANHDVDQRKRLEEYLRAEIKPKMLVVEFDEPSKVENLIRDHIGTVVSDLVRRRRVRHVWAGFVALSALIVVCSLAVWRDPVIRTAKSRHFALNLWLIRRLRAAKPFDGSFPFLVNPRAPEK